MATAMHHGPHHGPRGGDHGAAPILSFLIGALLVAVAALAFLAWSGQTGLSSPRMALSLPHAPSLPHPAPNPQPVPAPIPRPG